MNCPTLGELPPPLPGKTGWPWTEESRRLPNMMSDDNAWSAITVVTPSFNQGRFIEETIRSVLLQGYPNLEYFILDGASTDNSVEIIQKYAPWLSYWVSEPDSGQSDAINRGLRMGSGLFATWINSDDMLCKDAIVNHASRIGFDNNVVYVGDCLYLDETGKILFTHRGRVHSLEDLLHLKTVWRSSGHIVQPEALFHRELALSVGGLNTKLHDGMDYELWGKIFLAGARFQYTEIPFGMFRKHVEQKTQNGIRTTQALIDIASKLVTLADWVSDETKKEILTDLEVCYKDSWQQSGRLARSGLPPSVVKHLRNLKDKVQLKTVKLLFRGN